MEIYRFWNSYETDLCDALFGLWIPLDQESYLRNRDERNFVRTILRCFDLDPRESKNVTELDTKVFDASFIVPMGVPVPENELPSSIFPWRGMSFHGLAEIGRPKTARGLTKCERLVHVRHVNQQEPLQSR